MKNKGLKVLTGVLAAVSIFTMAGGLAVGAAVVKGERAGYEANFKAKLTEDEVLKIAREDADLKEKETDRSRVKLDYDDGILSYDVEFYSGNKEYDFEIDAISGEILKVDYEIEREFQEPYGSAEAKVSIEEATKTALAQVSGATEKELRIKADYDDGRLIYEGDILHDNVEYEFEISAETGKILSWESEKHSFWD